MAAPTNGGGNRGTGDHSRPPLGLRRRLAAACVGAVLLTMLLVHQVRSAMASATPLAPATDAQLFVQAQASLGASGTFRILVEGLGPATFLPTALRDREGLDTGLVAAVALDRCAGLRERSTGAGADLWCLQISGVHAGSQMTGVLLAPQFHLNLTVATRQPLVPWPLLAAAVGVLVAVLIQVLLTNGGLERLANKYRLEHVLEANRKAGPGKQISGLDEWVTARRETEPVNKLSPEVDSLFRSAPATADEARARLREEAEVSPLPQTSSLLVQAMAEGASNRLSISDFRTETGDSVVHPAETAMGRLALVRTMWTRLDEAQIKMNEVGLPAPTQHKLLLLSEDIREDLGKADADQRYMSGRVENLWDLLDKAIVGPVPLSLAYGPLPGPAHIRGSRLPLGALALLVTVAVATVVALLGRPAGLSKSMLSLLPWLALGGIVATALFALVKSSAAVRALLGVGLATFFVVVLMVGSAFFEAVHTWQSNPTFGRGVDYVDMIRNSGLAGVAAGLIAAVSSSILLRRNFT